MTSFRHLTPTSLLRPCLPDVSLPPGGLSILSSSSLFHCSPSRLVRIDPSGASSLVFTPPGDSWIPVHMSTEEDEVWVLWRTTAGGLVLSRSGGGGGKTELFKCNQGIVRFVVGKKWLVGISESHGDLQMFDLEEKVQGGGGGALGQTGGLFAVQAASAFTSVVSSFAKKWLASEEEEQQEECVVLFPKVVLADADRVFTELFKGPHWCAANDAFGRVFVFNPNTLHVVRVLKGYRCAQVVFVSNDAFLVFAPESRGQVVEIWDATLNGNVPLATAVAPEHQELIHDGLEAAWFSPKQKSIELITLPNIAALSLAPVHPVQSAATSFSITPLTGVAEVYVQNFFDHAKVSPANASHLMSSEVLTFFIQNEQEAFKRLWSARLQKWTVADWERFLSALETTSTQQVHEITEAQSENQRAPLRSFLHRLERRKARLHAFAHLYKQLENNVNKFGTTESDAAAWVCAPFHSDLERFVVISEISRRAMHVAYCSLLNGDVFSVKEVDDALRVHFHDEYRASGSIAFIDWFLNQTDIETCPFWHGDKVDNPVAKYVVVCLMTDLDHLDIVSRVETEAKGKTKLVRACLLISCCGLAKGKKEQWLQMQSDFERAVKIAEILHDEDTFSVSVMNSEFLVLPIVRRMITADGFPYPIYQRPEMQTVMALLPHALGKPEQRIDFAVSLALEAASLGLWKFVAEIIKDECTLQNDVAAPLLPEMERLWQIVIESNEWDDEKLKAAKQILLHGAVSGEESRLQSAAALEVLNFSKDAKLLSFFSRFLRNPSLVSGDDWTLRLEGAFVEWIDANHEKHSDVEARSFAKTRFHMNSNEQITRTLALTHLQSGRDTRASEAMDMLTNDVILKETALEMFQICRSRMVSMIRAIKKDPATARVMATISPEIVSWIMSRFGGGGSVVVSSAVNLRATQALLSRIRPFLSDQVDLSVDAKRSPRDRAGDLLVLIEGLLSRSSMVVAGN